IRYGLVRQSGLRVVVSQDLGLVFSKFAEPLLYNRGDTYMQLLALAAQERAISGILDEGVFKDERGVRRGAAAQDQTGVPKLIQRPREPAIGVVRDSSKQLIRELAANRGADLCYFLHRRQPVEPRHQRGLQARRDRQRRQWTGKDIPALLFTQ